MEFEDDAFVLAARPYGESGAIVDFLTAQRGLFAAHVAGGASRKLKPLLQAGSRVRLRYRARVAEQLGSASLEAMGEGPSALFESPLALSGLAAAAAVTGGALPERQPHPGAFLAFEALVAAFAHDSIWPAVFIRYEAGLLQELGFGLDLSRCAVTGAVDDLVFVSPRTGRAVSSAAGEAYSARLLALPPFLLSAQMPLADGDIGAGFALTGHFLETWVFGPLNKPLPPARVWMLDRLEASGRL